MRRNGRGISIDKGMDTKKMLFILGSILSLAIIAFIIVFYIYGNKLNETNQLGRINTNSLGTITAIEETSTSYGKTVNEMQQNMLEENKNEEDKKIAINTNNIENKEENTSKTEVTNTQTNKTSENKTTTSNEEKTTTQVVPDPEFKMPVSGEIMKEFADNKLVYSTTLDVWTTHNGIDIAADKTTVVKSAADGSVKSIKNDPRYGLTVIIEHSNGYKTIYSNLLTTEFVVEGEKVKQGQSIGTVGNTAAFEVSEEPHLHFELLKNNEQLDPELYLK
ncbi:MAG: peptidoglycan DD-metalloendopeptidase family protein [Clostridia bacterium]